MRNFAYKNPDYIKNEIVPELVEVHPCYQQSVYDIGMDKSVNQLEDVRVAIQVNIESIKSLLDQANSLAEIITPMEESELRNQLAENLGGIYSTIERLIENTDKLFDELKEYVATTSIAG